MNYSGKFHAEVSADGSGLHLGGDAQVETIHASQAPFDAIVVPDAHFLFRGEFKRSGVDLILSKDAQELVLHDYFKGEKRAALASPDGARLTGDIVNALSGHVEYAQADGSASVSKIIGHVTKLVGTATAIRNGVSIILNNGDNVEKGDVVESGADSRLGITFIDGTVFGLSSNARMVLNEMVYDPNGSNNSSLLSLVSGTMTFVAGDTAKHGDMKIDTPVATMGIRGTAVLVQIDFVVPKLAPGVVPDPGSLQALLPELHVQVVVEPDGTVGSLIMYEKSTLTPLAVADKAGVQINITNGIVSQSSNPLSPELQKLIDDVFTLRFTDNSNTKTLDHFTDTLIPQSLQPIKLASGDTAIPIVVNLSNATLNLSSSPTNGPVIPTNFHIDLPPDVVATGKALTVRTGASQGTGVDSVSGTVRFTDINAVDFPTVKTTFVSFKLQNAQHSDITATLTPQQLAQIAAVEAQLVVTPSPGNNNNGSATWTYNVADTAFNFLTVGETLILTYDAVVDNNYLPNDRVTAVPFTITISGPSAVEWIHPTGGLWSDGSNWSTGAVPTAGDDVIIPAQNIPGGNGLYDVTIATPAVARNLTLNANNTTGGQLINQSTLTIAQVLTILNNGVLDNLASGAVSVGGKIELLDHSSLQNSGLITLGQGGDFTSSETITNSGRIEVAGGTLNVQGDIANTGGFIQVDSGTTLKLNGAAINGGTIDDNGSTDVTANSSIKGTETDTVLNNGAVTVESGVMLTLDNVMANGTIFTGLDTNSTIQIEDGTVLTLTGGATVNGGTINDGTASGSGDPAVFGSIDVTGPSTINNALLNNGGVTVASGVTLTLDNDTVNGTAFNDTAAGAIIQIDDGTILTMTGGATFNGGTVNDGTASGTGDPVFGGIDVIGPSTISNVFLNNGGVTIASGVTLTLNNDTVTGTTFTDNTSSTVQGENGDRLALNGSAITGAVAGTMDVNGAVTFQSGVVVNGGALSIARGATLDIENFVTGVGATLNGVNVINSGTIQVDRPGSDTITVSLLLDGGTTIAGGTLLIHTNFPTGNFEGTVEIGTGGAVLENVTVANNNILKMDDDTTLTVKDVTFNGGTINDGTADGTIPTLGSPLVFGSLNVAASSSINGIITRNPDGTITTIDAILNNGGVTVASGATLTLDNVVANQTIFTGVSATGSIIQVDGGDVLAFNGDTINGGTLGGTGTIATVDGSNTLNGVAIASGTTFKVTDNTALDLKGTIANGGTIALNSSGDITQLKISGNVLLNDSGQVALTDNINNAIVSDGLAATLTNFGTIIGAGTIGDSNLTLVNNGTIDGAGTQLLTIDTGINTSASAGLVGSLMVTNNAGGVLEASAGHTLQIDDDVLNNGLIEAGNPGNNSVGVVNVTGNITGTGSIEIFNNAKLEIGGSVSSGETVTFGPQGGPVATAATLILDDSHDFHGTIVGLTENPNESMENRVDLKDLTFRTGHMSADFSGGAVTVSNGIDSVTIKVFGNSSGTFELAADGAGANAGTLLEDPPASGTVTIDNGKTLDVAAASTATVSFANSNGNTGELVLDNSKAFTGQIVGFAGEGTISKSDLIDLANVNIANVAISKTGYTDNGNDTGTLTLYNANGQALDSISFDGSYQLANFAFENDGSGHTLIVDQPVSSGTASFGCSVTTASTLTSSVVVNDAGPAVNSVVMHDPGSVPSSTITATGPNQTLSGFAARDTFVFNFADVGHATVTNFHPLSDVLQFGNSTYGNAQAFLNATHDDGHGNTVIAIDGHDTITLSDVLKAQLHIGDFHVV